MSIIKRERHSGWPFDALWSQDLIDGAFRDMFHAAAPGTTAGTEASNGAHLVKVEELVDGDTCVIRAELPGIDPEKDVDLTISDGVLHLRAERRQETSEENADGYRSEFHYGAFARSLRLPDGTTEDDVTATYRDGILEVRIPTPQPAEAPAPKQIPVSRS